METTTFIDRLTPIKMLLFLDWIREPEDLFGPLPKAKSNYKTLMKKFHSDVSADGTPDDIASLINVEWEKALKYMSAGTYGTDRVSDIVKAGSDQYFLIHKLYSDEIAEGHLMSGKTNLMRIPHSAESNDLMNNEQLALKRLNESEGYTRIAPLIPRLETSFLSKDAGVRNRINIIDYSKTSSNLDRLVTLEQLGRYYNGELHPKHIAWIWRKILFALDFAHNEGVIHGGLIPQNILVEPTDHLVAVSSWQFATLDRQPHTAVSGIEGDWYPKEINYNGQSTYGLDFYVAGKSMLSVGGATMPEEMKAYFQWVTHSSTLGRPQHSQLLIDEFNRVIEKLWGARAYFPMTDFSWPIYPEIE